jgi:hypothetical protein
MTTEFEPFPHPNPFDIPAGRAFAGWPAQILFEIQELLFDRSSDWLTAVASHIQELVTTDNTQKIFDDVNGPRESLAHSESWQFSEYVQPGRIGVFAALEPGVAWDQLSPPTERWQRYAVFAFMYLRDSVKILARLDKVKSAGRATNADNKYLSFDYDEAGAWALEAMRALQIAHSLRIDTRTKSDRGRKAANARHEVMKPKHGEALAMANSQPFKSKREAVDYIAENLTINAEGTKFCSRRAATEWLSAAGWQPEGKRNRG